MTDEPVSGRTYRRTLIVGFLLLNALGFAGFVLGALVF